VTCGESARGEATTPAWLGENPAVLLQQVSRSVNAANPYAPPRAAVSDAREEIEEVELASRGLRLGAYLLDYLIGNVAVYVPALLASAIVPPTRDGIAPLVVVMMCLGWLAWLVITIVLVARNGQTIGKKLLNIKVVRSDGTKATLGRIFWLRNFVPALLFITIIFPLIDNFFIFSETKQCLHDKIADTIVVNA